MVLSAEDLRRAAGGSSGPSGGILGRLCFDLNVLLSGVRDCVLVDYYFHRPSAAGGNASNGRRGGKKKSRCPPPPPPLWALLENLGLGGRVLTVLLFDGDDSSPFVVHVSSLRAKILEIRRVHDTRQMITSGWSCENSSEAFVDVSTPQLDPICVPKIDVAVFLEELLQPLFRQESFASKIDLGGGTPELRRCTAFQSMGWCGVAGWLLGYPVIYCLPIHHGVTNCLAMRDLCVYELWLRYLGEGNHSSLAAFSFSVPVQILSQCENILRDFKDQIFTRLVNQDQFFEPILDLRIRQENLPYVAL